MTTSTPSLQEFYNTTIQPSLDELDAQRRALVNRIVVVSASIGGTVLLVTALLMVLAPQAWWLSIVALFLGFIAAFFLVRGPQQRFREGFKQQVIGRIVTFLGSNLNYDANDYLSESEFLESWLFTTSPDRYNGEDMVNGKHGATSFRFSEVHAEYKTETTDKDGKTETHWHTIFRGILFVADFNKHFNGFTLVAPDTAERTMGFIGKALQSFGTKLTASRGELISLEDPEFEKAFMVRSTDQIEARYILSPKLMRRILDYRNRTGREIRLAFRNSNLYVAISTRENLFEAPSIFRSLHQTLDLALVQKYLDDLLLAIGIVDELDLNTRIWSKQAETSTSV